VFPYWLLFTVCAAGAIEHRRRDRQAFQGGPLLLVAGLFAALMIGLRFEVGGDWISYLEIFQYFRFTELDEVLVSGDPGYSFINWVTQRLGAGFWLVNVVCALIFTWGLVKFARRQPNPWLVLVVAVPYLMIVVAMGYTRQAVAIGFLLAGFATLHHGSLLRFAVYVACAAVFHKTAIIILPMVALSMVRQRAAGAFVIAILMGLLYYFFLQSAMDRLTTVYIESSYESEGAGVRVAMNIVPAAIFLLFGHRFGLPPQELALWRYLSLAAFGTLFLLLTLESSTVVDRLALYLIPLQLFVLSRVPYAFLDRGRANMQVALAVIIYCAVVQFVWLNYASNARAWVPYRLYPVTERPYPNGIPEDRR
jgi:hypothetical protein